MLSSTTAILGFIPIFLDDHFQLLSGLREGLLEVGNEITNTLEVAARSSRLKLTGDFLELLRTDIRSTGLQRMRASLGHFEILPVHGSTNLVDPRGAVLQEEANDLV